MCPGTVVETENERGHDIFHEDNKDKISALKVYGRNMVHRCCKTTSLPENRVLYETSVSIHTFSFMKNVI